MFAFNIPGEVPLFDLSQPEARLPAVDLMYSGQIKTSEEMRALEIQWIQERKKNIKKQNLSQEVKNRLRDQDISKLSPAPQLIQKNWVDKLFLVDDGIDHEDIHFQNIDRDNVSIQVFQKLDEIGVSNNQVVNFIDIAPQKLNNLFDFRVDVEVNGVEKQFRVYLGPLAHNMMLRKTLLRKLGYNEPGFKYLKQLKVKFATDTEAETFIEGCISGGGTNCTGLTNSVNEDPKRWVTNLEKRIEKTQTQDPETGEFADVEIEVWDFEKVKINEDEVVLNLQDVVIYEETAELRLSPGFLPHDLHSRQRIYNSLLMAFNIFDVPESVNSFSPIPFSVRNQKLILTHNYGQAINEYTPDIYDVKWMARKLASLSRKDFEHIVKEAHYPKEVEVLLVEILIARRNYMQRFFFAQDLDCAGALAYENVPYYCLSAETEAIHPQASHQFVTNLKISMPPRLVDGRLTIDTRTSDFKNPNNWWVGYGTRFSYHEHESPLVFSEVKSYLKSILQSSLLDVIIDKGINDHLGVDTEGKAIKIVQDGNAQDAQYFTDFVNALVEAGDGPTDHIKLRQVPFKFEHFPTASAQLLLNRSVVIGSQSGVDNQVQLVDTFGYLFKGGVHGQATGTGHLNLFNEFDSKIDEPLLGYDLDFTILKRWTHIRPIIVQKIPGVENEEGPISRALDEDYEKILVPKMLRDFKGDIEKLPQYKDDFSPEEKEAYKQAVKRNFETLNKYLKVGESLIISTSVGPSLGVNMLQIFNSDISKLSQPITGSGEFMLNFLAKYEDLSRIHIQRQEKNIMIYKTQADKVTWAATVAYKKYIPITSLRFERNTGKAKTYFYNLTSIQPVIGQQEEVNLKFNDDLDILVETISEDGFRGDQEFSDEDKLINKNYDPYIIWHDFAQNKFNFRFLFYNLSSFSLYDEIELYSPYNEAFPSFPEGETSKYARVSRGLREGVDYQQVALDAVNLVLKDNEIDGKIKINSGSDPADTLFGKSASVNIVLDAKVSQPSPGILRNYEPDFQDPFLKMHFKWKGGVDFGLKPKKISKLVDEINEEFWLSDEFKLFELDEFSRTERLQLYNARVDLVIFKDGFDRLFSKTPTNFGSSIRYKIFINPVKYIGWNSESDKKQEEADFIVGGIEQHYARAYNARKKGNYKKFMKNAVIVIQKLQENMFFRDFIGLFERIPRHDGKLPQTFRNLYMSGRITGFRNGDESLQPIFANEVGFSNKKSVNGSDYNFAYGDLELLKNRIGISDGEYYLNWLVESFIQ